MPDDPFAVLPIVRTARKSVVYTVYGSMIVLLTCLVVLPFAFAPSYFRPVNLGRIPLSFWMMLLLDAWTIVSLIIATRRSARLRIDQNGVEFVVNGETRTYRWSDITRTRIVSVRAGRNVIDYVQILRRGQITNDRRLDLVTDQFGFSNDEWRSMISAGVAKWGQAAGGDRLG